MIHLNELRKRIIRACASQHRAHWAVSKACQEHLKLEGLEVLTITLATNLRRAVLSTTMPSPVNLVEKAHNFKPQERT
jgi:hypothetical protein